MNRQFYDNEREIDLDEQKTLHNREKKIVAARTITFLAAVGSFAIGWDTHVNYCYIIAALFAMIFIRLVNYHDDLKQRKRFLKSRMTVLNSYIARARGTWRKRSNDGNIYLKNNRPQDVDLHIFGEGSIFQYICAARTKRGRDLLAAAFNPEPPDFNEVRSRQRGVAELLQRPRLSLDLEALARLMPNNHDTTPLIKAMEEPLPEVSKIFYLRFIPFPLILAIIFLSGSTCAAEDLKFIDAMEDTGYYYDADSVQSESDTVFNVKMAVIKANFNRMYTYDVKINHASRTYEILSSQILSYDTRAVLEVNNSRRPPQRYSDKSEMGQMVRLILYGD